MRVTLLPSVVGGDVPYQYLTSYLLNDSIAIDAGSLGLDRSPADQARVRHVFLSHSHIDHVGSLPVFVENVYRGQRDCVTIYGNDAVLESLQRDIFNNRVWPDFLKLSTPEAPFLRLQRLEPGQPVEIDGLRLTPVPVHHVVPTFGYVVEDSDAAIVIPTDTGPTDEIWRVANRLPNLKAAFLEVTFPNAMTWLAEVALHLTPALFAEEIRKTRVDLLFLAVHIKPAFRAQVVEELEALRLPNLAIGQPGQVYHF